MPHADDSRGETFSGDPENSGEQDERVRSIDQAKEALCTRYTNLALLCSQWRLGQITKLVAPTSHFPEVALKTAYMSEEAQAHLTLGSSAGHTHQRRIEEIHIPPWEYSLQEDDPFAPALSLAGGVWSLLMGTRKDPGALRAYMEAQEYMAEGEKSSYHTLMTKGLALTLTLTRARARALIGGSSKVGS